MMVTFRLFRARWVSLIKCIMYLVFGAVRWIFVFWKAIFGFFSTFGYIGSIGFKSVCTLIIVRFQGSEIM